MPKIDLQPNEIRESIVTVDFEKMTWITSRGSVYHIRYNQCSNIFECLSDNKQYWTAIANGYNIQERLIKLYVDFLADKTLLA